MIVEILKIEKTENKNVIMSSEVSQLNWAGHQSRDELYFCSLWHCFSYIFSFQESQILPLSAAESYREKYFKLTAASIIIIFICHY